MEKITPEVKEETLKIHHPMISIIGVSKEIHIEAVMREEHERIHRMRNNVQ